MINVSNFQLAESQLKSHQKSQGIPQPPLQERLRFKGGGHDSLEILADTEPPIMGNLEHQPSLSFLFTLLKGLMYVPDALRKALTKWGYKIVACPTIPDVIPDWKKDTTPEAFRGQTVDKPTLFRILKDLQNKNWWMFQPTVSEEYGKTVFMPERGWEWHAFRQVGSGYTEFTTDASQAPQTATITGFSYNPKEQEDPEGVLLHEMGHAVDDLMGYPLELRKHFVSELRPFTRAYESDIRNMTSPEDRRFFSYYLPREDNPTDSGGEARGEAFAELFSCLLRENESIPKCHSFIAHFPKTSQYIYQKVIKPWQELTKRSLRATEAENQPMADVPLSGNTRNR